jgi:transmembrane sensor
MLTGKRQIEEEAIGWVIRLRDAGPEAWEEFTLWLEASAEHAAAYEEAALADLDAGAIEPLPALPAPEPVEDTPPATVHSLDERRASRRAFLGWGIAASLVAAVGIGTFANQSSAYVVETGPGERRTVPLADGSRIEMNGSTRVALDSDRPRFARIEEGEALFRVVHDPTRPFEVEAGDDRLRDMGTVFNVLRGRDGSLEVAVAEGAVLFNPGREAAHLEPGMGLRKGPRERVWIGRFDREAIGGWQEGRLVYVAARVSRIAADLSRNLGLEVTVSPEIADRAFSGVIMLDGEPGQVLERASALLGVELKKEKGGWRLARAGATV